MIDIILSAHNRLNLTQECIEALFAYTTAPFTLTVIDDSEDLTPAWIAQFKLKHDNVRYIRPEQPFTSGNQIINLGLKETTSDPIVYLGNNVLVEPNWLDVAPTLFETDKALGIVGFKLLKYPTGVIEHAGIFFNPGMEHHMNIGVGEPAQRYTYICGLDIVGWALVMLRRAVFPQGLNEEIYHGFAGFDDIDNCLDARSRGWKVVYCGLGSAYHRALAVRERSAQAEEEYEQNRRTFLQRWSKK